MADSLRSRMAGLLPGTAQRRVQTEAYAESWRSDNEAVLAAGPAPSTLWVAIGDSTSQGIGASGHRRGWVGQTLELLRAHDDDGWQVVNLSVTGAQIRDVLDRQLPRLADLPAPALVTCAVGANDMVRGRSTAALRAIEDLLDALPTGTVVATIPRGVRERLAQRVNAVIRQRCETDGLRLADVWAHTGAPWAGKYFADGFHPNDRGYEEWVRAFADPLGFPAPPD